MTAFLKIDRCLDCQQEKSWEWVPPVLLAAKTLAGTAVWRSQLTDGLCPACCAVREAKREKERRAYALRNELIHLLGGEKPYREFTFERFRICSGNRVAFEAAQRFDCARDNLYLWGPCGVGKTHLAYAAARSCFEQDHSMTVVTPPQLSRKVRMKDPDQEQAALDRFVQVQVLILDDLGLGHETAFARQALQEILTGRDFSDRAGLVVTTAYSLGALAEKLGEDTIPSRLSGMCQVFEIKGFDHRLTSHGPSGSQDHGEAGRQLN
jgi:DNA replication protein DnaC